MLNLVLAVVDALFGGVVEDLAEVFANKVVDWEVLEIHSDYHETYFSAVFEMAVHFLEQRDHCSTVVQVVGKVGHNYHYTHYFEVDN